VFSLTHRTLWLFFAAILMSIGGSAIYSLTYLSQKLEQQLIAREISNLQLAIISGPVQLAKLHSAAISNQQLKFLMDELSKVNPQLVSAEIIGGENFSEVFGNWSRHEGKVSSACVEQIRKTLDQDTSLYPFQIVVSVDKCKSLESVEKLKNRVTAVVGIFTFLVVSLVVVFFAPINRSLSMMAKVLKAQDYNSSDISKIRYTPAREATQLAIESIKMQKFKVIAQMAQMITHDMRAPMGTFERLLLTKDNDLVKMKPLVKESVNRLYSMIDSLRRGDVEDIVRRSWVDLDFTFGYESLLGKANPLRITLTIPEVKYNTVYVDKSKIERAWINLASNALEFANASVDVKAERLSDDLIIRVVDDGIGVPADFIPRLFQRGASHGKSDGTGLGLAYVKQVMMGHGGDVRYYRENNLTVFECFIPNAFESKPTPPTEKTHVEPEIKEPLCRKIGIVFGSPSLSSEIFDRLSGIKAETMLWHEGFDQGYDFIITDDPGIIDKCIDEGISVAQFKPNTPASEIVRRTLIRLGVREIERTEDV